MAMIRIKYEFPVLVRYEKIVGYSIRPLFLDEPYYTGRRYRDVYNEFVDSMRRDLRYEYVGNTTLTGLLWLKFNPDILHSNIMMEFKSGKQLINQNITIISFKVRNHLVVHFPDFNNHMSILEGDSIKEPQVKDQIIEISKMLFRNERRRNGEDFDPGKYESKKGEFITTIKINGFIENPVPEEKAILDLFISIFQDHKFNGYIELHKVGSSLNDLFPENMLPALYIDKLTDKIGKILFQYKAAALALVGERGAGKTTALHGALRNYLDKRREPFGKATREIFYIDPNKVISGMSMVGMWQRRLEAIIEHLIDHARLCGKTCDLLYIDNPIALFRVGKSAHNEMTLSDVLKPYIEKRIIPLIIEATPEEWKVIQEIDRRFADLFQVIRLREMSNEKTVDVAIRTRADLEKRYQARIDNDGMNKLFNIQRLYLRDEALPGSVVKYMKQLALKHKSNVTESIVNEEFSEITNITSKLFERGVLKKDEVKNAIKRKLIGQTEAVESISDIIHVLNADLNDPQKPMASILFIGPTGVGKTQAAKVMTDYLFQNEDRMIRFDMNEYIDSDAVRRLVGDFYNPEGQLTGRIRYTPFCILLFDEIEKAHPDVHDLLLQVLGEGRLTDSAGRTVDFTNTIIIMTSNLGAVEAGKEMGFVKTEQSLAQIYKKAVEDYFRPELLNRIDEIVAFHRLKLEDVIKIADLMIEDLLKREGFIRRTTIVKVQRNALKTIAERGFDPALGARSLKRNIEKEVTEMAANYLIDITPDTPILFEMFLKENYLLPRITAFQNVDSDESLTLPTLDSDKDYKVYIEKFLGHLEKLELDIFKQREQSENDNNHNSINGLYEQADTLIIQDKVRSIKGDLESRLMDIDLGSKHGKLYNISFNIRGYGGNVKSGIGYHTPTKMFKDLYKQLEIKDYLEEIYSAMVVLIGRNDAEIHNYYMKLSYLHYFWENIKRNTIDRICIDIQPLIEQDSPTYDIYKLPYLHLWKEYPYHRSIESKSGPYKAGEKIQNYRNYIFIEGPGLYDLLKQESGIHLFYIGDRMYPVSVNISRLSPEITNSDFVKEQDSLYNKRLRDLENGAIDIYQVPGVYGNVIRLYIQDPGNSRDDIITDLRTQTMIKGQYLTEHDADLLLSFAIPHSYKPL